MRINVNSISPANQYKITNQNVAGIQKNYMPSQDKLEISSDAKLFADVLRTAKASIDNRVSQNSANLDVLKNKIANDEYHVSSNKLAEDILLGKE